jgi:hypothetical protein
VIAIHQVNEGKRYSTLSSARVLPHHRCGVNVIYEPEIYPPKNQFPPDVLLDALSEMMNAFADGQVNSNRKLNKENIQALEH